MLRTLIGFAPWIGYWVLSGMGEWTSALIAGLVISLALVLYRVRTRNVKTMEAVTLGYFAVNAIVSLVLGLPFFRTYGAMTVNLTLAAMAFGTLAAKSPFTYEYARESYPREYWNNPLFRRINEIITAV